MLTREIIRAELEQRDWQDLSFDERQILWMLEEDGHCEGGSPPEPDNSAAALFTKARYRAELKAARKRAEDLEALKEATRRAVEKEVTDKMLLTVHRFKTSIGTTAQLLIDLAELEEY